MINHATEMIRVLALRAIPGLINLAAILILSSRLTASEYGIYSTFLATMGLLSTLAFGPICLPIVGRYQRYRIAGMEPVYMGAILSLFTISTILIFAACAVASIITDYSFTLAAAVSVTSLRSIIMEILRSRAHLKRYFVSDLCQSATFLALCVSMPAQTAIANNVIFAYIGSEALAGIVALALVKPTFARPPLSLLRENIAIGTLSVSASLAEFILILGPRYLLSAMGYGTALGRMSLAVDLAQRTAGFVIAAVSFLYAPRAFAAELSGGAPAFKAKLVQAFVISGILGIAATAACVIGMAILERMDFLSVDIAITALTFACLAMVADRLRKVIADPIALAWGRQKVLVAANVIGGVVALALFGTLVGASGASAEFSLLAGYCALGAIVIPLVLKSKSLHRIGVNIK